MRAARWPTWRAKRARDRLQASHHRQAHARDGGAQAAEVRRQVARPSTPSRRACSKRRSTPTSQPLAAADRAVARRPAKDPGDKQQPKRAALPANLPRREIRHEPENTTCGCGCALKRIGEDVAEKLDYVPGVFTVERHVRGKWVCAQCETLVQAPVPAHIIDKGIPTAGLLAQVLVAKYADHLPLYRQEAHLRPRRPGDRALDAGALGGSVRRAAAAAGGCAEGRAAAARGVLHADETPVAMLKPGNGKTHRAYLWSYCTTTYDHAQGGGLRLRRQPRRAARPRTSSGCPATSGWRGKLVCDDFSGYKACFELGVTEAGCLAHARRKFHELWANHKSPVGERALKFFGELYDIEREVARTPTRRAKAHAARASATGGRCAAPVADAAAAEGARRARPRPRRSTTA